MTLLTASMPRVQAIQGVPKIEEGINPATWMLEVSSVGAESRTGVNFAHVYVDSKFAKCAPPPNGGRLKDVQASRS